MRLKLLNVSIDKVTIDEASSIIQNWVQQKDQQYVVTPNIEMIMASEQDKDFTKALNTSGLAIPDSARLGWGVRMQAENSFLKRLLMWPFFIAPTLLPGNNFPVTTGTDLMEKLINLSDKKGFAVGLLGGKQNVAIRLAECLNSKYPDLRVGFIQENLNVDLDGNHKFFEMENVIGFKQNQVISTAREEDFYQNLNSRKLDVLFVAFGHPKQEKWMLKNLKKTNIPVMLGVGGAFDYLSGQVKRAPEPLRRTGFEWLYRLVLQPWRIIRFGSLVKFVFAILLKK